MKKPDSGAAVVTAVEAMTAAFERSDLTGVLSAYLDEAVVAFEPGTEASGTAALSAGFEAFFAVRPRFTYGGHDVLVAGDLALHIAPWRMSGTAPDGTPLSQAGLSVAVLRRTADGRWKIALDNPFGDRLLSPG